MFDRRERRRRMSTAHYTILGPYLRGSIVVVRLFSRVSLSLLLYLIGEVPVFPNCLPFTYVRAHIYREVGPFSIQAYTIEFRHSEVHCRRCVH